MTELPQGWRMERFGDIFKVKYGKAIDKSLRMDVADFPVVGSAGVMAYTKTPLTSEPTIVIGRKGNVGSIQIFKNGCYPIDTTYYMPTSKEFDIDFLTHLLKSLELVKLDSSTATPSLRREDLEDVFLVIPTIKEQQKIVGQLEEYLSRLDIALKHVETAQARMLVLRISMLQKAFSPSSFNRNNQYKSSTLGNLADTQLGKMLNKSKYTGEHSMPYLRTDNIRWDGVDLSLTKYMDIFPHEYEKFTVKKNDVLVVEGGAYTGRCSIWESDIPMAFQNHIHRVRVRDEISPKFLLFYLEWLVRNGRLSHLIQGVAIPNLPQSALRSIEINYPPLDIQQKIVSDLEEGLKFLKQLNEMLTETAINLGKFRKSILQAAFTGQLTKEVASV